MFAMCSAISRRRSTTRCGRRGCRRPSLPGRNPARRGALRVAGRRQAWGGDGIRSQGGRVLPMASALVGERGESTMQASLWLALVVFASLCMALPAAAQAPVGALADRRAVRVTSGAGRWTTRRRLSAQERALGECGSDCSVVLTFRRCAAYAADQDADSTAVGWAEAYASADAARQAALAECSSRGGGSGCIVRAWGCNSPVVEEGLDLDLAARRQIQQGLAAGGFNPGGADGLFGPRTRAAIRRWQSSRGARSTGYLDGASAEALRTAGGAGPAVTAAAASAPVPVPAAQQPSPASSQVEVVFWQSIANSTNPAEFEAYLRRFPNGVFSELAQARLAALALAVEPTAGVGGRRRFSGLRRGGSGLQHGGPAAMCRADPARSSETALSVPRWWCCPGATWRWAATR